MAEVKVHVRGEADEAVTELERAQAAIEGVGGTSEQAAKGTGELGKETEKTGASLDGAATKAGKAAAAFLGIGVSVAAAVSAVKQWIGAAGIAERAGAKLETILRNLTGASADQVQALKDQAAALQRVTGYDDDLVISAQAMLGTFKLTAEQIQILTPRLLDMAESARRAGSSTVDLESQAMALGRAFTSGIGALGRYGVAMDETQRKAFELADQQGKVQILAEILDGNFKGMAEAVGDTYEGALRKAIAAQGDFQEELGFTITKNAEVAELTGAVTEAFVEMGEGVKGSSDEIKAAVGTLANGVEIGFGAIRAVWNTAEIAFKSLTLAINTGIEGINRGLATITWGKWSQEFGVAAETVARYNRELRDSIGEDMADMEKAGRTMIGAWDDIGLSAEESAAKQRATATAMGEVTGAAGEQTQTLGTLSQALQENAAALDDYRKRVEARAAAEQAQARAQAETLKLAGDQVGALRAQAEAADLGTQAARESLTVNEALLAQAREALEVKAREVEASGNDAKEIQGKIKALTDEVEARRTAVTAAEAAVTAAEAEAESARRAALTYGDQSAALDELTRKREEAVASLRALETATREGIAAQAAMQAAKEYAARAEADYREALQLGEADLDKYAARAQVAADKVTELSVAVAAGEAAEKQAAIAKAEIARLNAQVADAARDAVDATEAQIKAAERAAQTLRSEAEAEAEHLRNLANEAKARGELQEAGRLYLEAAQAEIEVLQIQVEARQAQIDASARHAEALVLEAKADGEVTTAEAERVASIQATIAALQAQQVADEEAIRSKEALAEANDKVAAKAGTAEVATARAAQSAVSLGGAVRDNYAGMSQAAAEFFDAQMKNVRSIDQWWTALSDQEFARVKGEFEAQVATVDRLAEALRSGAFSMGELGQASRIAKGGMALLDDEQLTGLRSAVAAAKAEMDSFTESARDGLSALRQEWAALRGDQVEVEQLRAQERRLELEEKITEAQRAGNREATDALRQQLALLDQINAKRIADAKVEKTETVKTAPALETVKTVNVNIGGRTVRVIAGDEAALLEALEKAGEAA